MTQSAMPIDSKWVIWSEEHSAWWAPGERGYTNSLRRAGRYTEAEAKEIEANANRYMLPRDFHEVALPDPVTEQWLDSLRKSR